MSGLAFGNQIHTDRNFCLDGQRERKKERKKDKDRERERKKEREREKKPLKYQQTTQMN